MSKFMRNKKFSILRFNEIIDFIKSKEYTTWGEFQSKLGMKKKRIRRVLKHTELCVSLNSKRQYFTLRSIVLKKKGPNAIVWIKDNKVFSAAGTLKKTVLHIVQSSPKGIDEKELSAMLLTPTKNVLTQLKDEKKVKYKSFEGRTVYFSSTQKRFSKQFQRHLILEECDEIQISFEEFFKTLNPEIKKIAQEIVPKDMKKSQAINLKEFTKLILAEPKLAGTSDRHMSRLLRNNNRIKKLIKTDISGHSAISKYKELLTVDFYVKMFEFMVEKVVRISGIKLMTILTDCTVNKRYKRDNTHFRCHTATIAELKCPIALIVTKGRVHESPIFERILSKIEKLKVKIKYVICDAGYDAGKIFVRVAKRLKAVAVIPTRDFKKRIFDIETFQLSLDYYFEEVYTREILEIVETTPEKVAGERIRELVDSVKKLDWWKEIYKMRTGVERMFSWAKAFLGLTRPNAFSLKQVSRHSYQIFFFIAAQTLCSLKLGIFTKTASFKSFII